MLTIRQTISHYTILGKLGEGGMGVVYKAHDTKLDRDVALKFLTQTLTVTDTDQARFLQEARSAALLNHPNICTIYDVLEMDEASLGGKQSVIVMEYVDGKSLRAMLPIGSLKQATELGMQIASGLAAAHEKGLIHRDIKPENIMVFKGGGRAVIMDFGLAKLKGVTTLTRTGTTVGTVKYMSPEQITGGEVDHRSDIFSLGVVLYEMFTGHSPFKGEHEAAVLYEIANVEPPLPSSLRPEITSGIETLLLECLAKDPNDRLQSAAEVRRRLASCAAGSKATTRGDLAHGTRPFAPGQDAVPSGETARPAMKWSPWLLTGFLGIACMVLGMAYVLSHSDVIDLSKTKFTPIAGEQENEDGGSFSPDGRSIAYIRSIGYTRHLLIKDLDPNASPTVLATGLDPYAPFWSATGDVLYFLRGNRLWSIGTAGGEPHIQFDSLYIHTAALSPDGSRLLMYASVMSLGAGKSLFNDATWSLFESSPPGTPPHRLLPSPYESMYTQPVYLRISPDGSKAALSKFRGRRGTTGTEFWVIPLTNTEELQPDTIVWESTSVFPISFDWLSDSRSIVFSLDGTLWFGDTHTGRVRRLTASAPGAYNPRVSRDGTKILYSSGIGSSFALGDMDIVEVPLDGSPPQPLLASSSSEYSPSWSRNGDRMAYVTERSAAPVIWIRGQHEDLRACVTTEQFPDEKTLDLDGASISPDGKRVAYCRLTETGLWRSYVSPTDGGRPTPLLQTENACVLSWSPDGRQVAAVISRLNQHWLVVKTIGSQDSARIICSANTIQTAACWSPKGNWIACGTEGDSIMLISPDGTTMRSLRSPVPTSTLVAGYGIAWKDDGSSLYIVSSVGDESRLDMVDIGTGESRTLARYGKSVVFDCR